MYGAFHPDAQKGGENDTLLTNKAKSGSNSRILVAVGALCAVSGALVGAYALSGSNGYGVSSLMRLGASETCGMDHCLTLLQGPSDQLDSIFQESFDTVCTQANQVVEQGSTHGLKENPKALCTVPKCFDILNAELGKVSKDETKQQSMKDVVITQFYDVCFPTSTAAMGKNKHQTKVAKVGHNAHAVAPKTSTKRSRLGSQCNVDACLVLLRADDEQIDNIFGESFETVCVKSREYSSNPNAELGGPEDAVCQVNQCFDMLNIALPNEDNKLKDIIINEFQALCYGGASATATLGKGDACTIDACLTMLRGDEEDIDNIFGESFETVCVKSREYSSNPNAELGGPEDAVCQVNQCFDMLNIALPNEDNKLKDIIINEFQALCYGGASAAASVGKKETKHSHVSKETAKVGYKECNVDACLVMLQGDSDELDRVFGESFTTVCTQSRSYQAKGELGEGEENTSAICSVPKCFDTLNIALSDDNNLKDIVINEFDTLCFPEPA